MLQDNVEGYRKEIVSLREKTQKQAATGQKSEQTVHTLTQDLRAAREKLSMVEVSVFMLLFVLLSSFCPFFLLPFSVYLSKAIPRVTVTLLLMLLPIQEILK